MTDTKERITKAALDLFSEYGYEKISVAQIAEAVGIKAPSLYKHFASKQEIFDSVLTYADKCYERESVLAVSNTEKRREQFAAMLSLTAEQFAESVFSQMKYIVFNPVISKTRRLLCTEQFRNPQACEYIERRQFTDIYDFCKAFITFQIENGRFIHGDVETMALQIMSPVVMLIQRIDRNPAFAPEAEAMIKKYIVQFYELYGKENKDA